MKSAIFFLAVMGTAHADTVNYPNELLINKNIRFFAGVPKVLVGPSLYSWETKQKTATEVWAKDHTYVLATKAEKEQLTEFTEMGYDRTDSAEFAPVISHTYEITNGEIKSGTICRMDVNLNVMDEVIKPLAPKPKKLDPKTMECWTINQKICAELNRRDLFVGSLSGEASAEAEQMAAEEANEAVVMCKGLMGVLEKLQAGTLDQVNGPQTINAQKKAIISTQQLYQSKMSQGTASFKMKEQQPLNVKSLSQASHILDYYAMAKVACGKMKMYRTEPSRQIKTIKDINKPRQPQSPVTS